MHKILKYQEPSGTLGAIDWFKKALSSFSANRELKKKEKTALLETPEGQKEAGIKANNINTGANLISAGLDVLPELAGGTKAAVGNPGLDAGLSLAADAVGALGPWGQFAKIGIKGFQALNNYAGKTADSLATAGATATGYDIQTSDTAGLKFSLLNSGKKLRNANRLNASKDAFNMAAIQATYQNNQNQMAAAGSLSNIMSKNNMALYSGMNSNIVSVKSGGALKSIKIIKARVGAKIQKAQSGEALDLGKVEDVITQNVIPEGALHARLNNYEGELGEQVTNKGIPVITYEKGDKILQHAEIEHSEIIFNKTTSDKLEELYKEYKDAVDSRKKELEIECGKLLTVEILENTNDNVGLLNNIE